MQLTLTVTRTITIGNLRQIQATGIEEAGSMETTVTRPTEVLTITLPPVMHKGITRLSLRKPYLCMMTMNIMILEKSIIPDIIEL